MARKKSGGLLSLYRKEKKTSTTPSVSTRVDNLNVEMTELKTYSKVSALNSMYLPMIAHELNLIRQNIFKITKTQTGVGENKTDQFFQAAKEKEAVYESQFKKTLAPTNVTTKPTPVGKTEETNKGFFGGILDFFKGILGTFLKGAGLTGLIVGIGKILEDPETRQTIKNFLVDVFTNVFNGLKQIIKVAGETLSDPKTIDAMIDVGTELFTQLKNVVKAFFSKEVDTEYGKFSIGQMAALGAAAVVGVAAAYTTLKNALLTGAANLGKSLAPGGPTTVPPGTTAAGAAGAGAAGAGAAGAAAAATGGAKIAQAVAKPIPPGMSQTASGLIIPEKVKNELEKKTLSQGAKAGAQGILRGFLGGAAELATGPIGTAWLAAYAAYQIVDALAPTQQEAVLDSIASLVAIQQTIDDIDKGSGSPEGKKKAISFQLQKAQVEESKLKFFGVQPTLNVQAPTPPQAGRSFNRVEGTDSDYRATPTTSVAPSSSPTPTSTPTTSPIQYPEQKYPGANIKLDDEQTKMAGLIFDRFKQAGFTDQQANAAVVNAYAESKLRPQAKSPVTPKEESYGLFQMNTKGGLGQGHDPQKLMDPNYNITLAIDAAKKSKMFVSSKSLDEAIKAFTIEVERPANMLSEAEKRVNIASSVLGKSPELPTASPPMLASSEPSPSAATNMLASSEPSPSVATNMFDKVKTALRIDSEKVNAATIQVSQARIQIGSAPIVVAPPTVNVQAPQIQGGTGGFGAMASSSVVDTEFMKLLVGRTVTL